MSSLEAKREELRKLEEDTVKEHKELALSTAKDATNTESMSLVTKGIAEFFSTRIKDVELCTNASFNWTMSNTLQGGSHDRGTMVKIKLVDGVDIMWSFNQRWNANMWLRSEGKNDQLMSAQTAVDLYMSDQEKEDRARIVTKILGESYADIAETHFVLFMGMFMGALDSFLATYEGVMRKCPVKDHIPAHPENIGNMWGAIFKE